MYTKFAKLVIALALSLSVAMSMSSCGIKVQVGNNGCGVAACTNAPVKTNITFGN